MTYYVPGLGEKDPDKIIRSLMQAHEKTAANTTDITTNTAAIAALTSVVATKGTVTSVGSGAGLTGGPITGSGSLAVSLSSFTASLGADVALNNISNYFPGPAVAQGTTGTWLVTGTITARDTAGVAGIFVKLWDGTTVIASARADTSATNFYTSISVSGIITNPAGNLRIDVRDASSASGVLIFNGSGNSKDSTITAVRIA